MTSRYISTILQVLIEYTVTWNWGEESEVIATNVPEEEAPAEAPAAQNVTANATENATATGNGTETGNATETGTTGATGTASEVCELIQSNTEKGAHEHGAQTIKIMHYIVCHA